MNGSNGWVVVFDSHLPANPSTQPSVSLTVLTLTLTSWLPNHGNLLIVPCPSFTFPLLQSAGLRDTNAALKSSSDILGWLIDFPGLWFSVDKSHVKWQCLNHASLPGKSNQSIPLPLKQARHLSSCRLCYSFPLPLLFFFSITTPNITIPLYIHSHHSPSQ